jgi:hypothetical protein
MITILSSHCVGITQMFLQVLTLNISDGVIITTIPTIAVIKFNIRKANARFLRRNQDAAFVEGISESCHSISSPPINRASANRLRMEASTHACAAEIDSGKNQNQEQAQIASETTAISL